ncbi:hypothetical protein SH668x_002749 [Planctomicrobium sp. SH668]|uniref:hypothetical protein n=1 Tax=Planctomicrobium sp. SH668 TaxID=3448126 RepID=UPI003F5BDCE1
MYDILKNLDRRWIFLMMALAVGGPILFGITFPETPTTMTRNVFDAIENLPEGSKVLMAWDYDPSTEGELGPMATAFTRHCCEKKLKMYFITLLPVGPQMIEKSIETVIKKDFPDLTYGTDYVNLGYKSGYEGVIKVIITNLRGLYTTDARGTGIDQIPMCKDVKSVQDTDLIINVSGAYPGVKEWVQYAVTPYPGKVRMVSGLTGVQAPMYYPYVPKQMIGMLGAIKGAAEYEVLVNSKYSPDKTDLRYTEANRRMGPQMVAHLLMIGLIIVGNIIYFIGQRREAQVPVSH